MFSRQSNRNANSAIAPRPTLQSAWMGELGPWLCRELSDPQRPTISVQCIICQARTLDLSDEVAKHVAVEYARGWGAVTNKPAFYDKYDLESTAFLVCGHVVGADCMKSWRKLSRRGDNQERPVCPLCPHRMRCTGPNCGEFIKWKVVDMVRFPLFPDSFILSEAVKGHIPLTEGEGYSTPSKCEECIDEEIIDICRNLFTDGCPLCVHPDSLPFRMVTGCHQATRHDFMMRQVFPQTLSRLAELIWPETIPIRDLMHATNIQAVHRLAREEFISGVYSGRFRRITEGVWRSCRQRVPRGQAYLWNNGISPEYPGHEDVRYMLEEFLDEQFSATLTHRANPRWTSGQRAPKFCDCCGGRHCWYGIGEL